MDTIQSSLESKKYDLTRAQIWSDRFGKIAYFFAVLNLLTVILGLWNPEMYTTLIESTHSDEIVKPTVGNFFNDTIIAAIVGWWFLRVRDAFQAITVMIEELAETV